MPIVRVPAPLRDLTRGAPTAVVEGEDVRAVLAALEAAHPGVAGRVLDADGGLQRYVNVFVGERDVRTATGLDTPVGPQDTVTIIPAVAGG